MDCWIRLSEKHVRFSDGQNTVDLAAFKAFLEQYKPEAVAAELGIAAPQIREVAFLFARSQATTSLWTMGINQRTQGVFLNNMLNALHLITGQIGRPGATPFSFTGQTNACGGVRDTGSLSHLLPAGHIVANAQHRHEVEQLWGAAGHDFRQARPRCCQSLPRHGGRTGASGALDVHQSGAVIAGGGSLPRWHGEVLPGCSRNFCRQ